MEFIIIAHDATDSDAYARRMAARPNHLARLAKLKADGQFVHGVGLLNDDEKLNGSVLVCRFDDRAQLDAWLRNEPYLLENVWDSVEIRRCAVPPV